MSFIQNIKRKFKDVEIKKAERILAKINALDSWAAKFTDEELKAQTDRFKEEYKNGKTLDELLPEVFAISREATFRVLEKKPFNVQMIGGIILHGGNVAEMRTGEGKTITSIAPVYLNAITGNNVLVSTVNEYLAARDAEEMGLVFNFLGLTVGLNKSQMQPDLKRKAYAQDITYSIHSEIGFDYLRDNMVGSIEEKVQRGFHYILLDEVDSILIDEARTPLIISGGSTIPSQMYENSEALAKQIEKDDVEIDWETKAIFLKESGVKKAESFFNLKHLYDLRNSEIVSRIQNAIRAKFIMIKNVDYIVKEGKILLIDQSTGRIMEGRAYSEGLQQAIQAKEAVEIEPENQTQATITYQNLFRMFGKLSGMTGTGKTEEQEFIDIYNMRVIEVPTNKPVIRVDQPDALFVSSKAKWRAVVNEIKKRYDKGQPVLVGTAAVENSEIVSKYLKKFGIPHSVLNAKNHELEAEIIAKAGEIKAVTIATNMAGRGTDIKLNEEVRKLGGLYVLGTEKNDSRRVDNQLRGRSGRQGDVGESRFFISLQDDLILRFSAADKLQQSFKSYGNDQINSKMLRKAINKAQVKIENLNYDSRKNVLEYDDVIRQQREVIYAQRDIIISIKSIQDIAERMIKASIREFPTMDVFYNEKERGFDPRKFTELINRAWFYNSDDKIVYDNIKNLTNDEIVKITIDVAMKAFSTTREDAVYVIGEDAYDKEIKNVIIQTFDNNWVRHIDQLDKKRSASSIAAYAQKNPLQVYVQESNELFQDLISRISHNISRMILPNKYRVLANNKRQAEMASAMNPISDKENNEQIAKENFTETISTINAQLDVWANSDIKPTKDPKVAIKNSTKEKIDEKPVEKAKQDADIKKEEIEETKVEENNKPK